MFQVGQHVICVDDEPHGWGFFTLDGQPRPLDGIKRGTVYTVADNEVTPSGIPCIVLAEIKRPGKFARGYASVRFRPLSSDRLSIFRQHLAPSPTDKVDA